jgi:hypothetical protein
MKRMTVSKKLQLNKDHLRRLTDGELEAVAGGATKVGGRCLTQSCPSVDVCVSLDVECPKSPY